MLVLVLLYDETCMPKIKYIKYRVVHVYTLGNYDNYYIIILDYENLAFHFLKSFHLCEFSFFHRYDISGKVDISDLTWEQKERVIRYLFARMNGGAKVTKMNSGPPLPAIENKVQRLSITHEPRYVYLTPAPPPQQAQLQALVSVMEVTNTIKTIPFILQEHINDCNPSIHIIWSY